MKRCETGMVSAVERVERTKLAKLTKSADGERRVSRKEMDGLVRAFSPLVASLAHRYEGRGAEAEDLRQEGYLGLVRIARSVNKRQLRRALAYHLPAMVRDAADGRKGGPDAR